MRNHFIPDSIYKARYGRQEIESNLMATGSNLSFFAEYLQKLGFRAMMWGTDGDLSVFNSDDRRRVTLHVNPECNHEAILFDFVNSEPFSYLGGGRASEETVMMLRESGEVEYGQAVHEINGAVIISDWPCAWIITADKMRQLWKEFVE